MIPQSLKLAFNYYFIGVSFNGRFNSIVASYCMFRENPLCDIYRYYLIRKVYLNNNNLSIDCVNMVIQFLSL